MSQQQRKPRHPGLSEQEHSQGKGLTPLPSTFTPLLPSNTGTTAVRNHCTGGSLRWEPSSCPAGVGGISLRISVSAATKPTTEVSLCPNRSICSRAICTCSLPSGQGQWNHYWQYTAGTPPPHKTSQAVTIPLGWALLGPLKGCVQFCQRELNGKRTLLPGPSSGLHWALLRLEGALLPSRGPRAFSAFASSRPSCAAEGGGVSVKKGWRETTKLIFHRIPIQSLLSLPAHNLQI